MRKAISLLELIVVVSILTILGSLLLNAIQDSRESARLVMCKNNLRQLTLGVQNHVAAHRHIPSNGWGFGWIGQADRGIGRHQPGGWAFQLLPMIENAPAYTGSSSEEGRALLCKTIIPPFDCPSRPSNLILHTTRFVPFNVKNLCKVAKTDYAICEGDFITDTREGPTTLEQGDNNYRWIDPRIATGVSFQRSEVSFSQVSDGLSNTYLIGEKHVNAANYLNGLDLGYDQSLFSGVDLDLNRWVIQRPIPDRQHGRNRQFGSAHRDGFNMSFCDGSVHFISYAIGSRVHVRLGNRKDGREGSAVPR